MLPIVACAVATALLVWAEWRGSHIGRAVFKLGASTLFVLIALQSGAMGSAYGRWVLSALALSWLGDALLLSARGRLFLLGIGAFLLAHVAFSVAFLQLPMNADVRAISLVVMAGLGFLVLRWLWRHLSGFYRTAVGAYVMAIVAMCALAISVSAASGHWSLALAALVFAASDVSVARDRFVSRNFINRAWGLPLYYAAQVGLALSVG